MSDSCWCFAGGVGARALQPVTDWLAAVDCLTHGLSVGGEGGKGWTLVVCTPQASHTHRPLSPPFSCLYSFCTKPCKHPVADAGGAAAVVLFCMHTCAYVYLIHGTHTHKDTLCCALCGSMCVRAWHVRVCLHGHDPTPPCQASACLCVC